MSPTAEILVRIGAYAVVFAALAAWEFFAPRREFLIGRVRRWPGNLGVLIVDIVTVRLLVPTAAVGAAVVAAEQGWGLFHLLPVPGWIAGLAGFVLLDL